jgi:uncharacterized protein YndB with AHSA1/START domain
MGRRADAGSKLIRAPASRIYRAFATPDAMTARLPPEGMVGTMLAFECCEGGKYRMRLASKEPEHTPGKASVDADEVEVQFVKLVPHEGIEQAVTLEGSDPSPGPSAGDPCHAPPARH